MNVGWSSGSERGSEGRIRSFFGSLYHAATEPSEAVSGAADRARARLVAALLLFLLPSAFGVSVVLVRLGPPHASLTPIYVIANLCLTAAWLQARGRTWRAGLAAAISALAVGTLATGWFQSNPVGVSLGVLASLTAVGLASVALPTGRAAVAAAFVTLCAGVVAGFHPSVQPDNLIVLLALHPFLSAMLVLAGAPSARALDQLQERSAQLAESETRYALAARGANDTLWDWDLRQGTAYFSPRWQEMLGLEDQPLGQTLEEWLSRVHVEGIQRLRTDLGDHVAGLTAEVENVHRVLHGDGTYRWMLARGLAFRDEEGKVVRVAGSLTDVTEQKQFEEQLLHDAFHDPLTGLPNRALFLDRLEQAVRRAHRRADTLFGVLFLDLDRFKVINDSLGHTVGDQLLKEIALRVEACLRPGDTVARLGGDEFTVLLNDLVRPNDAELVAGRIQESLKVPFRLEGHEVVTSTSIGIALSTQGYSRAEDLIRDADTAMYRAKADGKARHRIFDRHMHENALHRLRLESDMRQAIDRQEFELHYQPIISLQSGQIEGFEALVRWQHPERSLIMPGEFIGIAEETGLINPLGWWVLRTACMQARAWQQQFPRDPALQMNVNLSGRQFRQPDLVRGVVTALNDIGLPPESLRLEITESVLMETAKASRTLLEEMRGHGIRLCIDDFGTGYSSLNYLHSFDIDVLKIDRSFVKGIRSGRAPEIVQTIVNLSRSLGLAVTAEGIETRDQLAELRGLDVELGQGFYFSRGLNAERATRLLERDPTW